MAETQFFKAAGPQEACDLLAQYGSKARVLAGGTDLMVAVNQREFSPEVLIYIGDSGVNYIKWEKNNLAIGAATPYTDIMRSDLVLEKTPLLAEAVSHIASPAIRNVGTIGGNLANASPAADSATPLLALGASLRLVSKEGERLVAVEEFFTGPGETLLKPTELIKEAIIPVQAEGAKWAYRKLGRRKAQTLSIVSVAIYCPFDNDLCRGARIALGAVAPTPILAVEASNILEGKTLNQTLINEAARAAAAATNPIDDVRGSAWYRRRATEALVRQLLAQISA
ncbi:MAG: xanthine dehydrogenase family protein subunit M [Pseudomonadota bacterium]